jgi:hypothetical protein
MVELIVSLLLTFGCPLQSQINFYSNNFNGRKINKTVLSQLIQIEEINPFQLRGYCDSTFQKYPIQTKEIFFETLDSGTIDIIGKCKLFNCKEIISILILKQNRTGKKPFKKEIFCLNIKNEIVNSEVLIFCEDEISETFVVSKFDKKQFILETFYFCPKAGINSRGGEIILNPLQLLMENSNNSIQMLDGAFFREKKLFQSDTLQVNFIPI